MRTITETKNTYTFDELTDEAKEHAHEQWLSKGDYWGLDGEARDTIKEIEKLFRIKLKNWSIGDYRPEYPDIEWEYEFWSDDREELKGNRARSFLWNNFGHVLLTGRYYGRKCRRYSRFFFDRVYNGTCPLTGVCFDCDALDPLAYFCFGVEWSDKQVKRVPSARTLKSDDKTVEDIISDCVYAMFDAFNRDVEDSASMEHFADFCQANDYEFDEYGNVA